MSNHDNPVASMHSLDNARVPGCVWLREVAMEAEAASFGLLSMKNIPALCGWRRDYIYDPFWRLFYNFTSGAHFVCAGKKFSLRNGQFVIVPANLIYETFLTMQPVDHFFFHFTLNPSFALVGDMPLVLPANDLSRRMVTELAAETRKETPDLLTCYHFGLALLHYVLAAPLSRMPTMAQRPEVSRLLDKIEADPAAFANAAEMAGFAGMSLRNLQRSFQSATGKSPTTYLNETRLREAARRLAGGTASIDQIAEDLGFANRFHFSRLFRSFAGSPPAEFRSRRMKRAQS